VLAIEGGVVGGPLDSSKKPFETRYESGTQVMPSRPRLAPTAGRSPVRFHSWVAVSMVPGVLPSNRRMLRRLIVFMSLLRSVET